MPTTHTTAANGIRIHYELSEAPPCPNGQPAPRLLILPGSGADLRRNNAARPLQDRFTTLTLDQRGLGQTQAPPGPYTMADYAADAIALLDALEWDTCHLLGISFGGMVAQEVAIVAPRRLQRLVLACSSSGGAGGASAPLHEYTQLPLDEQTAVRMEVFDTRQDAAWREAHPEAVTAFRDRLARAAAQPAEARRGPTLQLLARAEHDTYDRLHLITTPTLIAAGRYDGQAPPENQRAIQQRIPNSRLQFFEGGHGFLAQAPTAYPAIAEFLLAE